MTEGAPLHPGDCRAQPGAFHIGHPCRCAKAKVWLVYVHPNHRPASDADVRGWLLNTGHTVSVDDEIVVRESKHLPPDGALYVFDAVAMQGGPRFRRPRNIASPHQDQA